MYIYISVLQSNFHVDNLSRLMLQQIYYIKYKSLAQIANVSMILIIFLIHMCFHLLRYYDDTRVC